MATKWDPVAYSAATRRGMLKAWEQISLSQAYLDNHALISNADRLAEYAKIIGLAIALVNIAEAHRQYGADGDVERYQAVQGRYARLSGELRFEILRGKEVLT